MNRRSSLIVLVVAVLAVLGATLYLNRQSQDVDTRPLKVGIVTWPGEGVPFVAKEKGYFGNLPVEITVIDDTNARHAAFKSGGIDIMAVTVDSFALEAAQVRPGKLLFVLDFSKGGDGIVARKEINSAQDLRGKRIAFPRGTPSEFLLLHYLKQSGLGLKDIIPVEVDDASIAGQSFIAGNVDAAATWEPFVSQAAQTPQGKVLFSTADAPDLIIDSHVASDEVFNQRRAAVETYAKGIAQALEYIKANPDDAYQIMAKGLNMPEKDFRDTVLGLQYADKASITATYGLDQGGKSRMADVFNEAGLIWTDAGVLTGKPISSDTVIDTDFIRRILQ